jgi:hypothetical protein
MSAGATLGYCYAYNNVLVLRQRECDVALVTLTIAVESAMLTSKIKHVLYEFARPAPSVPERARGKGGASVPRGRRRLELHTATGQKMVVPSERIRPNV